MIDKGGLLTFTEICELFVQNRNNYCQLIFVEYLNTDSYKCPTMSYV